MDYVDRLRQLMLEKFGLATTGRDDLLRALAEVEGCSADSSQSPADRIERPDEMLHELAGQLIPGESYFSRHPEQLTDVVGRVSDLLGQRPTVSIWSAGCARGEEPYSIAMQLAERFGKGARPRVKLVGTDLNRRAIETAKTGVYSAWSLRTATPAILQHFSKQKDGGYLLGDDLRGWVEFHHASIQDHLARIGADSLDIVLFRNVGIYLDPIAMQEVHRGFARCLKKDGILLQAATDPLPSSSLFLPDSATSAGTYRLRSATVSISAPKPSVRPLHGKARTGGSAVGRAPAAAAASRQAVARVTPYRAQATPRAAKSSRRSAGSNPVPSQGPGAATYVRRAQLSLDSGNHDAAVADLRAALYIEPGDCLARYWYYLALHAAGQHARAKSQLQELARQLDRLDPSSVMSDGRTTAGDLGAAVQEISEALA